MSQQLSFDTPIYDDQLRHVARPDTTPGREEATSVTLTDYEGLYVAREIREYVAYEESDETKRQIGWAYAEYIDMVVRGEEKRSVTLYAHTEQAKELLIGISDDFVTIDFE